MSQSSNMHKLKSTQQSIKNRLVNPNKHQNKAVDNCIQLVILKTKAF